MVEREILRLERIVNDFLQFARPAEPQLATIPAEQLLLEVQTFLRAATGKDRHPTGPGTIRARCRSEWTRRRSNRS